jgi:predicted F0F1-ATPase subunit
MSNPDPPDSKSPLKNAANSRLEVMRTFGSVGTIGLSFAFAVGIGVALGVWIDRVTGWGPWGLVTFFIIGFVAGVLNVYRSISRMK